MSDLTAIVYTGLAHLHVQNEQWDEAVAILQEGVEQSATALARSQVLLCLCDVRLSRGEIEVVDGHIAALEALVPELDDYLILSAIHLRKAAMLAQRNETGAAAIEYDRAIALLDGHNEQPAIASLYAAKHGHLLQRSGNIAAAFDDQDRRMDLAYDGLHPLIRARLLEQEGLASIAENKALDALQAYNQAMEIYEQYRSSADQQRLYARQAQMFEQTGYHDKALVLYARFGDTEAVRRICAVRANHVAALSGLDQVLTYLAMVQTDEAKVGRASALGALADVLPDAALPAIFDELLAFLGGQDSMDNRISVRRAAASTVYALAARTQLSQLTGLADALLAVTEREKQSDVATIAEAVKAIGKLVAYHHKHIAQHHQVQIVGRLLEVAGATPGPLGHEAFKAAMTIALNAGGMSRNVVADYLRLRDANPLTIAYLSALGVKISPEQLQSTLDGLLAGIGTSVVSSSSEVKIASGAYIPRVFENLKTQLSAQHLHSVIQGLIRGIDNEHDSLGSRGQMLCVLGQLADLMSAGDVLACAALCQRVVESDVPVSAHLAMMQQTAGNPFSNYHEFSGTKADVLGGAAWAIAHLFGRLHGAQRTAAINTLRQLTKDPDPGVRRRVVGSVNALRGLRQREHQQLVLPLIVLFHDADVTVRGLTVQSAADLNRHNAVAPNVDIAQHILELGLNDPALTVRTAVAYALKQFPFDTWPALAALTREVQSKLEVDPSFQVRLTLAKTMDDN